MLPASGSVCIKHVNGYSKLKHTTRETCVPTNSHSNPHSSLIRYIDVARSQSLMVGKPQLYTEWHKVGEMGLRNSHCRQSCGTKQ